jgi:hypothetical protein
VVVNKILKEVEKDFDFNEISLTKEKHDFLEFKGRNSQKTKVIMKSL